MRASMPSNMLVHILLLLTTLTLAAPHPRPRPWVVTEDTISHPPSLDKRQTSSFWMETIQRQGQPAYNPDKSYKVFRNVKDYGAVGDGQADDTAAINKAISDGNRCGDAGIGDCDSSTVTPAIVYFPAGTYKVTSAVIMLYYTQMIGDATNLPRIQGAANFDFSNSLAILDADPYIPNANGAGYYTNQNNFFRQIRNLVIDMTQMPEAQAQGGEVNGVHWQVAQACSMQNVVFDMKPASATNKQRGIMTENGSGMFMSDIVFNGGNVGAFFGSQQFTTRNLTFNGCNTAVKLHWDWLWTFKSLNIQNCGIGLDMTTTNPGNETVGSAIIMDSKISASTASIYTSYNGVNTMPETGSTLLIHNVDFAGSPNAVVNSLTNSTVLPGNVKIAAWGQGNVYIPSETIQPSKRASEEGDSGSAQQDNTSDDCPDMEPETSTVFVSPVPSAITATVSPLPVSAFPSGSFGPQPPSSPPTGGFGSHSPSSFPTGSFGPNSPSSFPSGTFPPQAPSSIPTGATGRPSIPSSFTTSSTATRPSNATVASGSAVCSASPVAPQKSQILQQNMNAAAMPSSLLSGDGAVFERSKPQYIDVPKESFVSIKSFGATGDGTTDDSDAVQKAMSSVTKDQVLYFDHGAYVITKTIEVPANIRIVGEVWPMIMVSGTFFSDQNNPQPAFRVGKAGDTGNVEISDMMFSTKGPVPGAVMMQWNVQEASQGSVGMWDTHFRVGGSAGTDLQQAQCSALTSSDFRPECAASFLMMHVSQSASGYFENTWFWVADHDLDLPRVTPKPNATDTQISLFNGRGILVESQGPVWLWGTASEHSVLYNYQLSNAKNVFMAGIQTETAYMQPAPNSLGSGFTPNAAFSDPDFLDCTDDSCKKTWGMRITDSQDIFMFGGGLYSFFQDYTQDCTVTEDCQINMVDLQCSTGVYLYGLATKASVNQVTLHGSAAVLAKDNPNNFAATVLLYQQQ